MLLSDIVRLYPKDLAKFIGVEENGLLHNVKAGGTYSYHCTLKD
jgi:hypothetical protein